MGETGPRAAGSVPCIVLPRISERFVEDPWTQALFRKLYKVPVDLWLYVINGVVAMGGATTFQRAFRIPDIVLMFLRFVGAARALTRWRRRGRGRVAT